MTWTFAERIAFYKQQHPDLVAPAPAALTAVWRRGQARGLPLRTLFVLRSPLAPRSSGGYERATGDAWVLAPATADADRSVDAALRSLLHELGHAAQPASAPTTIDEDWDREADAWRRAGASAADWGLSAVLSPAQVDAELDAIEQWRNLHHGAAALAGRQDPRLARAMADAIFDLAAARHWSRADIDDAVWGVHTREALNAAMVLDVDRTGLRGVWSIPVRRADDGLGALACDATTLAQAAAWLRPGLETAEHLNVAWQSGTWGGEAVRIRFVQLDGEAALRTTLAAALIALVDDQPDRPALATWTLYGDTPAVPHCYRLSVRYSGRPAVPGRELWVLVARPGSRVRLVEAALQGFLASWSRMVSIRAEPLADGLELLWNLLPGLAVPA